MEKIQIDLQKAIKLANQGKTIREISEDLKVNQSVVRRRLKEANIVVYSKNTKVTEDFLSKLNDLLEQGKTNKEIALELNISPETARKYTYKLGKETNSKRAKTLTKSKIELTQLQLEVLYGSLLGDMSIDTNWKNARPIISQGGEQEEYFDYKCKIFEGLLGKINKKDRYDKRTNKFNHKYYVKFLTNPFYTKLKEELYINGVKTVTRKYLDKITPRGLAFWFMDDGCNSGTLATNCFSLKECELIQDWFLEKWNIKTTIQHQNYKDHTQYLIYIKTESRPTFYKLVIDYFIPSMEYKLKNWNP